MIKRIKVKMMAYIKKKSRMNKKDNIMRIKNKNKIKIK
jgi:hypothetical protein